MSRRPLLVANAEFRICFQSFTKIVTAKLWMRHYKKGQSAPVRQQGCPAPSTKLWTVKVQGSRGMWVGHPGVNIEPIP